MSERGMKFGESRTRQSDYRDSDINYIMKKYIKTGMLPEFIKKNPTFGDFSKSPDYQTALDIVLKAKEQFDLLDVNTKKRFDYNPKEFLEFVEDPKNKEELYNMGLAKRPEKPKVETVNKINDINAISK